MISARASVTILALLAFGLVPSNAHAQEVSLTVGRLLGDDIRDDGSLVDAVVPNSFSDAGLYGVRLGIGFLLFDVEASLLRGDSAVREGTSFETAARFTYAEASAVLRILPGPIAPFVAAGLGVHRLSTGRAGIERYDTIGYNLGAGLKVGLGAVGVRADLRDHITPLTLADLDPDLAALLGLDSDLTVHNFELSLGLTIAF